MLNFDYQDDGTWVATSAMNDEGTPFDWVIEVTETGKFSVSESEKELLDGQTPPYFLTHEDAVDWCNEKETQYIESLCENPSPTEFDLGAFQQAWHMACAACNSLNLDYRNTSPMDIAEAIAELKRK